jgi:hypothetical protein
MVAQNVTMTSWCLEQPRVYWCRLWLRYVAQAGCVWPREVTASGLVSAAHHLARPTSAEACAGPRSPMQQVQMSILAAVCVDRVFDTLLAMTEY